MDDFDRSFLTNTLFMSGQKPEKMVVKLTLYESHQIPEGVTIPSDVVGQTHDSKGNRFVHYRLNPDFDPSVTYVPRERKR